MLIVGIQDLRREQGKEKEIKEGIDRIGKEEREEKREVKKRGNR